MTYEQYTATVARIRRDNPSEPLLNVLEKGYSKINEVYLKQALRRLEIMPEMAPEPEKGNGKNDAYGIMLQKEKKTLYGRRARLSNQFHDCSSDQDRAVVSEQIQDIQKLIEDVRKKIAYFEKHGEPAPEERSHVDADLPTNPIQLMNKLNSVRSAISYAKRQITKYASKLPDPKAQKMIDQNEERLRKLEIEKINVEKAIAKESI